MITRHTLGDILANGPKTAGDIAYAAGVDVWDPVFKHRVRLCVDRGIVDKLNDGRYILRYAR